MLKCLVCILFVFLISFMAPKKVPIVDAMKRNIVLLENKVTMVKCYKNSEKIATIYNMAKSTMMCSTSFFSFTFFMHTIMYKFIKKTKMCNYRPAYCACINNIMDLIIGGF